LNNLCKWVAKNNHTANAKKQEITNTTAFTWRFRDNGGSRKI